MRTTQFFDFHRTYQWRVQDKDNSGSITTDEFLAIPEFAMNPLAPRIVRLFNSTATDVHPGKGKLTTSKEVSATPDAWTEIGFKQFVETLAVFSPRADRASKLACMLCLRERASGDTRFPGMHVFNTYGLPNFRPTDAFRVFDVGGRHKTVYFACTLGLGL